MIRTAAHGWAAEPAPRRLNLAVVAWAFCIYLLTLGAVCFAGLWIFRSLRGLFL